MNSKDIIYYYNNAIEEDKITLLNKIYKLKKAKNVIIIGCGNAALDILRNFT